MGVQLLLAFRSEGPEVHSCHHPETTRPLETNSGLVLTERAPGHPFIHLSADLLRAAASVRSRREDTENSFQWSLCNVLSHGEHRQQTSPGARPRERGATARGFDGC